MFTLLQAPPYHIIRFCTSYTKTSMLGLVKASHRFKIYMAYFISLATSFTYWVWSDLNIVEVFLESAIFSYKLSKSPDFSSAHLSSSFIRLRIAWTLRPLPVSTVLVFEHHFKTHFYCFIRKHTSWYWPNKNFLLACLASLSAIWLPLVLACV